MCWRRCATSSPDLFATLRYRIVEPFPVLQQRQQGVLRPVCREDGMGGVAGRDGAVLRRRIFPTSCSTRCRCICWSPPVKERTAAGSERLVERTSCGFTFVDRPISDARLLERLTKLPPAPEAGYETEINLAALDWIDALASKLRRGVVLIADYGLPRDDFYAPSRRTGTLQCYAEHRVLPSLLEQVGQSDLTHARRMDQPRGAGGKLRSAPRRISPINIISSPDCFRRIPELASAGAEKSRALQTLIHPEFLGNEISVSRPDERFPVRGIVRRIQVRAGRAGCARTLIGTRKFRPPRCSVSGCRCGSRASPPRARLP